MVKVSIIAVEYYTLININCPKSLSNITMRRSSRQVHLELNSKYFTEKNKVCHALRSYITPLVCFHTPLRSVCYTPHLVCM